MPDYYDPNERNDTAVLDYSPEDRGYVPLNTGGDYALALRQGPYQPDPDLPYGAIQPTPQTYANDIAGSYAQLPPPEITGQQEFPRDISLSQMQGQALAQPQGQVPAGTTFQDVYPGNYSGMTAGMQNRDILPQAKPYTGPEKPEPYQSAYGLEGSGKWGDILYAAAIQGTSAYRNKGIPDPRDLQDARKANLDATYRKQETEYRKLEGFAKIADLDMSSPIAQTAARGFLKSIGITNKEAIDSYIKDAKENGSSTSQTLIELVRTGKLPADTTALARLINGKNGHQFFGDLARLSTENRKLEKEREDDEAYRLYEERKRGQGPTSLSQAPGPGVGADQPPTAPIPQGPGSTGLQQATGLVQRAQALGIKDPRIVSSLVATEASGDSAISPKGATGKFQVIPATGRRFLKDVVPNIDQLSDDQVKAILQNPAMNEHAGLGYIKYLEDKFPNNPSAVAAAYFSGEGNVGSDGKVIDPARHDGNLTVPQYQERFTQRYKGQAPPAPTSQPTQTALVLGKGFILPEGASPEQAGELRRLAGKRVGLLTDLTNAQDKFDRFGDKARFNARSQKGIETARFAYEENEKAIHRIEDRIAKRSDTQLTSDLTTQRELRKESVAPEQTRLGVRATAEEKRAQENEGTLLETHPERFDRFFDTTTGTAVDPTTPTKEAVQKTKKGDVKVVSKDQQGRLEQLQEAAVVLRQVHEYQEQIYGKDGLFEKTSKGLFDKLPSNQLTQKHPLLTEAQRYIDSHAELIARTLYGVKGAGTEGDVERARKAFPQFQPEIVIALEWPPKFGARLPDTVAVSQRLVDTAVRGLNQTAGSILGKKDFAYPGFEKRK